MNSNDAVRRTPSRISFPVALVGNLLLTVSALGASPQSIQLQKELGNLRSHLELPATSLNRDRRRRRFHQLAWQWRADTQWLSSTTEIAMHPAYQSIIGMGPEALPMIISELRTNSGHWYWALKAISNEDPVPPGDRGVIRKMRVAWLHWADQQGIALT